MQVTKLKVEPQHIISLELTREEARSLIAVCRGIGGSQTNSRRKHFSNLDTLLSKNIEIKENEIRIIGSITFYPEEGL